MDLDTVENSHIDLHPVKHTHTHTHTHTNTPEHNHLLQLTSTGGGQTKSSTITHWPECVAHGTPLSFPPFPTRRSGGTEQREHRGSLCCEHLGQTLSGYWRSRFLSHQAGVFASVWRGSERGCVNLQTLCPCILCVCICVCACVRKWMHERVSLVCVCVCACVEGGRSVTATSETNAARTLCAENTQLKM